MISGILIAALMLAFFGIAVWAYSSRQRERFLQASQLPLQDEETGTQDLSSPAPQSKVWS